MIENKKQLIIGRYDPEIVLKSRYVRLKMIRLLLTNLSQRLKEGLKKKVSLTKNWDYFELGLDKNQDYHLIKKIIITNFGVDKFYLMDSYPSLDFEEIKKIVQETYQEKVRNKKFAVRLRFLDKPPTYRLDKQKLEAELGGVLYPFSQGVNLNKPEILVSLWLDFKNKRTLLVKDSASGPGGYPLWSDQKALVLFSGGIDSPVAAWLTARKGLKTNFLFVNQAGPKQLKEVTGLINFFYRQWLAPKKAYLFLVSPAKIEPVFKNLSPRVRSLAFKRYLYRLANEISQKEKIPFIVSGESLNQVSTQTSTNLLNLQTNLFFTQCFFRPLIGLTKREITDLSRQIGTLTISQTIPEYCGQNRHGAKTISSPKDIEDLDRKIQPLLSELKYQKINLANLKE